MQKLGLLKNSKIEFGMEIFRRSAPEKHTGNPDPRIFRHSVACSSSAAHSNICRNIKHNLNQGAEHRNI